MRLFINGLERVFGRAIEDLYHFIMINLEVVNAISWFAFLGLMFGHFFLGWGAEVCR